MSRLDAPPGVLAWRLTRKGSAVYAMLLLPEGVRSIPLQRRSQLALPFAVGAAGGVDGSWCATAPRAHTDQRHRHRAGDLTGSCSIQNIGHRAAP